MFQKVLLIFAFVFIKTSCASRFPGPFDDPTKDPRLTVINVYSGLEAVDGKGNGMSQADRYKTRSDKYEAKIKAAVDVRKLPFKHHYTNELDLNKQTEEQQSPWMLQEEEPSYYEHDHYLMPLAEPEKDDLNSYESSSDFDTSKNQMSRDRNGFHKKPYNNWNSLQQHIQQSKWKQQPKTPTRYYRDNLMDMGGPDVKDEYSPNDSSYPMSSEKQEFVMEKDGFYPKAYNWNSFKQVIQLLKDIKR